MIDKAIAEAGIVPLGLLALPALIETAQTKIPLLFVMTVKLLLR
jgi:hypothetical protein